MGRKKLQLIDDIDDTDTIVKSNSKPKPKSTIKCPNCDENCFSYTHGEFNCPNCGTTISV